MNNIELVVQVLGGTLHHETTIRSQAEAALLNYETQAGFAASLLQIIVLSDQVIDQSIKQAAILRLKHNIQNYWDIQHFEARNQAQHELNQSVAQSVSQPIRQTNPLTPHDREIIKNNLFEAIVLSVPIIRVQLLECVKAIAKVDLPDNWPSIDESIIQSLRSDDFHRIHCGLLTLLTIVARWELVEADRRSEPIIRIVNTFFPQLLEILQIVNQRSSAEDNQICHIVCKIVYKAIHLAIPAQLRNAEAFMPWFNALLTTLSRPVPVDQSINQSVGPAKHPLWKAKKWVAHLMLGIFSRFGFEKDVKQETNKAFAKNWRYHCVKPALNVFFQLISQSASQAVNPEAFVSSIVKFYAYEFFRLALKMIELRRMILGEVESLISKSILSQLSLTHNEIDLFINDPQEFIRLTTDILEDFKDPRRPAAYLLIDLCQLDAARSVNKSLNTALLTIDQAVKEYNPSDELSILRKEGAMRMMVAMRAMVLKEGKDKLQEIFINHIQTHVVPELSSSLGFMKVRALDLVGAFHALHWTDAAVHARAMSQVCNCLLPNQSLPVRLSAIGAVSRLITDGETLEMLGDAVTALMDACFALIDEVGNNEVIEIMTVLFEKLGERLIPFVAALVQKFCAMILALCEADDGDDESALACTSAIQMVGTVVTSLADRGPDDDEDEEGNMIPHKPVMSDEARMTVMASIEPHILPVIGRILGSDNLFEFYDDCVDLVNAILYTGKTVSTNFWPVLPRLIELYFTERCESTQTLTSAVDCFSAFGGPAFAANSVIINPSCLSLAPVSPLDHVVMLVTRLLGAVEITNDERINKRYACKMLHSVLAHHRGRVDHIFSIMMPQLVTLLLNHGAKTEKEIEARHPLNLGILDTFSSMLIYDATLFLNSLLSLGGNVLGLVFDAWVAYVNGPHMDASEYHCRMSVLGFASLCSLPRSSIPPQLHGMLTGFMTLQIQRLAHLKSLYDAMENEDGQYDDEDYGWEEGDYAGREEDWDDADDVDEQTGTDAGLAAADGDEEPNPATNADWLKMAQAFDEEGVEDAHYDSPVDELDPFIIFADLLNRLPAVDQQLAAALEAKINQTPTILTALNTVKKEADERKKQLEEEQ